jgi:hypothetical protein
VAIEYIDKTFDFIAGNERENNMGILIEIEI